MATYIGVNGKARKVKDIYIGVNGKARKVKKAYIGVNGKARLCYTASGSSNMMTITIYAGDECITDDIFPCAVTIEKGSSISSILTQGGIADWFENSDYPDYCAGSYLCEDGTSGNIYLGAGTLADGTYQWSDTLDADMDIPVYFTEGDIESPV